jgi:ferredoxin
MQVCPSIFGLDEDAGKVSLIGVDETDCGSDIIGLVKEAVDSCPVGCINE